MKTEFIENLFRLVVASEGKAWEYRNGQDSLEVANKITEKLAKKYSKHPVANTTYKGKGPYANLDPEVKAAIDMYIMEFGLVKVKP